MTEDMEERLLLNPVDAALGMTEDMEERLLLNPVDAALEIVRSIGDLPPAHYKLKVESMSLLSNLLDNIGVDKYESRYFEIDGYKWRLSLYPSGDKKRNVMDHISLYLVLAETSNLPLGTELNVFFKFFVYDQIRDKYLTIEDASKRGRRFHVMKTDWGFSKLLSLSTFNHPANGYLVDDCAIFGVEVFIRNSTTCKGESISIINAPAYSCFTWKINNFSSVLDKGYIISEVFTVGGYKWYLHIYPNEDSSVNGTSLSFFLSFKDFTSLKPGQNLYAEYDLRIQNQVDISYHRTKEGKSVFCSSVGSWGSANFMPLSDLRDSSKGFLVNDTVMVDAQINVLSAVKYFS